MTNEDFEERIKEMADKYSRDHEEYSGKSDHFFITGAKVAKELFDEEIKSQKKHYTKMFDEFNLRQNLWHEENAKLIEQNERYRVALEKISEEHWTGETRMEIAQNALKEDK